MDQRQYTFYQTRIPGPAPGGSLLSRILRLTVILGLLVLGFMFSLVLFAVLAVGGVLLWGFFWWKTRKFRQQMQEQGFPPPPFSSSTEGRVIEGQVIRAGTDKDIMPEDSPPRSGGAG